MVKEYNVEDVLRRVEICLAELGMPKETFYAESGVSSASYSQWNKGVHEPTAKKIKQMADCLGVTVHYLITGEGKKEKPPADSGGPIPKYSMLTPENRAMIDSLIDKLLESQSGG